MNETERRAELARRLGAAGAAHGEYESQVLRGKYISSGRIGMPIIW